MIRKQCTHNVIRRRSAVFLASTFHRSLVMSPETPASNHRNTSLRNTLWLSSHPKNSNTHLCKIFSGFLCPRQERSPLQSTNLTLERAKERAQRRAIDALSVSEYAEQRGEDESDLGHGHIQSFLTFLRCVTGVGTCIYIWCGFDHE